MQILRIAELLQNKNRSQRWLARETGIALPTINAICRGTKTTMTHEQTEKIALALNVSPEELYIRGG